jgi:hypothetical protein
MIVDDRRPRRRQHRLQRTPALTMEQSVGTRSWRHPKRWNPTSSAMTVAVRTVAVLAVLSLAGCDAATPPSTPATRRTPPSARPREDRARGVSEAYVPNANLTPGIALDVGPARICAPGYAESARDVSDAEKAKVYARYDVRWVPYRHEVDHLISLELGGSNAIRNLWPEPYAGRWGARTKDTLENRLHALVCAGELSLRAAQRQEATNWVAAYRRYVGRAPNISGGSGPSEGGYYASRYPSASTIYCADDPAWRSLSRTYLVHFDTLAQARARFPRYRLHQPC